MRTGQGYAFRPGFSFGPPLTPAIKALLAANITVYVLMFFMNRAQVDGFYMLFGLVPNAAVGKLFLWQFLTYMFLHAGFLHIFFNMFVLWMFGSELEMLWGRRAFLRYFFVTGVGAGLIYALVMPHIDRFSAGAPLIGASGAVYGILTAYGMLFPERRVLLWFLVPIKVKWFVIGLGAFEFLAAWKSAIPRLSGAAGHSNIGHLAHLGGILFGVLYLRWGAAWWERMSRERRRGSARRRAAGRFHTVSDATPPPTWSSRPDIDAILEKISREGLQSLTDEEREVLRRASRKH